MECRRSHYRDWLLEEELDRTELQGKAWYSLDAAFKLDRHRPDGGNVKTLESGAGVG